MTFLSTHFPLNDEKSKEKVRNCWLSKFRDVTVGVTDLRATNGLWHILNVFPIKYHVRERSKINR